MAIADPRRARILVAEAEEPLLELVEQWLEEGGYRPVRRGDADLVVVDLADPRAGGRDVLRRIGAERPGAPVIALSSTFLPGVEHGAAVAGWLGVAAALPKPVARATLLEVIGRLLRPEAS